MVSDKITSEDVISANKKILCIISNSNGSIKNELDIRGYIANNDYRISAIKHKLLKSGGFVFEPDECE